MFGVAGLTVGFIAGHKVGCSDERAIAVKAGVARWQADPATGAVRFEYQGGAR